MSSVAPAVIAVGVIRAGAPTISSAFEVVREEALPSKSPRRPALRPERRPFPKISTNNDQLMMAIRVCVHFGVAQAIPLFTTILVRCGGKVYCWPSVSVLMGDTGASERTVERWRRNLVDPGLIVLHRRWRKSSVIRLSGRSAFVYKVLQAAEAGEGEASPYPSRSTDNVLLMTGARVLVAHRAPEAFALYVVILVRCGGKGHCWASTEVWRRDTGAPRSTVERWRSILVRVGLIVVEHRGNKSGMIRLTALAGFRLRLLSPEPDTAGDDVSGASRTATYEGASTLIVGGTEDPNRNLEKAPLESEDKTEGAAARRSNAKRSGGRQAQAGKRKIVRETLASTDQLVNLLAQQRRVADPKRNPLPREQDLMRDPRFRPLDWQQLRAASGWSESEQRQMDDDYERLGDEDHAYHLWIGRWEDKWRRS